MKKKVVAVVWLVLLIPAVAFAGTTVHQLGALDDSVSLARVRWQSQSKYDYYIEHGDSVWSALGKIDIRRDYGADYELMHRDYNNPNDGNAAYERNYHPGIVYYNIAFMDYYTQPQNRAVAAHELGHALGFGDHYDGYGNGVALMFHCARCTADAGFASPRPHDNNDYYARWR